MIIGNFADSDPALQGGYLDRLVAKAVKLPSQPQSPTLSLTIPELCCDCLGVFGGGSEDYQNDKSTFFYRRSTSGDTITLKLKQDGTEVATITDNTYGTLYDFGTYSGDQADYKIFIIDWDLVYNAFGGGVYLIDAEYSIIGSSFTTSSQEFKLLEYNDYRADGTVRFEWTQNGRIRNSEFDYTGLNITQYLRLDGKFGGWEPALEKDEIIYSNYERKQVQDEVVNSYNFESTLVDSYISKLLVNDMMLADSINVTDFNLYNHRKDYINFQLRQDEVSVEEFAYSDKAVLNLKFTDKIKNTLKQQ